MKTPQEPHPTGAPGDPAPPMLTALDAVLAPLAQLCVAKGLPIQAVEERLRHAFVAAARQACADTGAHPQRLGSRISALTGLTRREVTRIENLAEPARPISRSPLTELFTRWMTRSPYCGDSGPLELPRQGPEPSFETLANSVTRDVHARSLLDGLCRLGLAEHDPKRDTVRLGASAFVPRDQWAQMLGFLGDNVGDHLRAAVVNVLGNGREHFEQSLYADELSRESLQKAQGIVSAQWERLLTQVVPQLEALMREDEQARRPQDHCLRLGLYSWMQTMPSSGDTNPNTPEGD